MPGKTPLKIFIASAGELEKERDQAILVLTRLNNAYKNLHLEPVRWEYAMVRGSFPGYENISAAIIPKLQESDLAVFIFHSRLGVYTLEEFECAKRENKKTLLFFKNGFSPNSEDEKEAFNKLNNFKNSLNDTVLMIDFDTPAAFERELYANIHLLLAEKNIAAWHCIELNNIPNVKPAEFVGRTNELKELHHKIIQGNRVLVMNGIGGVGKTTLAKKYLHQHKQEYNHAAYIEIKLPDDSTDAARIIPACHDAFANDNTLAVSLELQFDATVPNEVKFNRIINKLRNLPGKGLLVLDNMPLLPASSDLMDILPAPPGWTVLVTSRNVISALERYDLDTLAPEEAITLFKKFYTCNCTEEEINELLEEIGYHTLTTELLAKTLQNTDGLMHIKTITEKIKSKKLDDASLQEKIITAHHNKGETTVYLHLSQALSMAHLSDEEKWIMKNFAFLMPSHYSTATLIEWLQLEENAQKQLRENLHSLLQKGWLQQKEANSYTMHRMLQQLVQYQLAPVYNDLEKLNITLNKKLNPTITTDYRVLFSAMPYAEYFLQSLSNDIYERENTAFLLNLLGEAYRKKGEYDKAIEYYERALKLGFKLYGEDHSDVAICYDNLGKAYYSKGEYDKMIENLEKALKIAFKFYGEDHIDIARCYNDLGGAYQSKGEYDKVIEYLEKALKIAFKFYGEENPDIAICYDNLGKAYYSKGENDKAIEFYQKALKIDLKFFGEDNANIAADYNSLGTAYNSKGENDKAIEFYQKALQIYFKFFGEKHPAIGGCYNDIGAAYYSKGENDKAIEFYQKALQIYFKFHGEKHPAIGGCYNDLGAAYYSKGENDKAIEFYQKALQIYLKFYGEEHPKIAIGYNNLGAAYYSKGENDKAIEFYQKALQIYFKFHGEKHPAIARCYNNFGEAYHSKVEYDKAIEYYEKALNTYFKFYGEEYSDIVKCYNKIGLTYHSKGGYDKAIEYYEKALKIYLKFYGEEHLPIATLCSNLGLAYFNKGGYDKTIAYFEQSILMLKKFLPEDHPSIQTVQKNLAAARDVQSNSNNISE